MNRDEICRKIAEKLEAKPEGLPRLSFQTSPLGFWASHFIRMSSPDFWSEDAECVYEWRNLDFYSDEAASAKLLEAMPGVELLHIHGLSGDVTSVWRCRLPTGRFVSMPDRKTAIVLAAMQWLGIESIEEAQKREH